jgi:stage V sporulation protein D (sporulation-specific penicillin-binding protein)
VLALANYPSYSLNEVPRNDMELLNKLTRNGLVCDIYEPGSTFKIITSAINIEENLQGNPKAFSPRYVFNSSRTRAVDGTKVKCWSNHANGKHSNQTLAEALNNSCNPCFTDIALSLGKETFYEYLSAFGFGARTGIDYGGEAYGLLMPQEAMRNCDLARIGFGQTIAVSGIQLACATAAALNGGYYYTPHLVKRIYAEDGYILQQNKKMLQNRTISEEASKTLAKMLEGVVKDGSGKKAYIEGYKIAGKTGTAQTFENGKIAVGKYVSSFVGFFPADKPQYLALVIVKEPQGAYYGSVVAAPCAREIFEGIISLKNIQPRTGE